MKILSTFGLLLLALGASLLLLQIKFPQFNYCAGVTVFGTCLGLLYNYTWLVALGVILVGLLLLVHGTGRKH